VPVHNFIGWIVKMIVVYVAAGTAMKHVTNPSPVHMPMWFDALPVATYWLVAIDMFVLQPVPQLRIVDLFTMVLISVLASIRLAQSNGWQPIHQEREPDRGPVQGAPTDRKDMPQHDTPSIR
jgi:hypothetical protein